MQVAEITVVDNSGEVKRNMEEAVIRALERCGLTAEAYAVLLCPVDTGRLRNSLSHKVDGGGDAVYIGTNVTYSAYV